MRKRHIFSLLDCGLYNGIVHGSRIAISPRPMIGFELERLNNRFIQCGQSSVSSSRKYFNIDKGTRIYTESQDKI